MSESPKPKKVVGKNLVKRSKTLQNKIPDSDEIVVLKELSHSVQSALAKETKKSKTRRWSEILSEELEAMSETDQDNLRLAFDCVIMKVKRGQLLRCKLGILKCYIHIVIVLYLPLI